MTKTTVFFTQTIPGGLCALVDATIKTLALWGIIIIIIIIIIFNTIIIVFIIIVMEVMYTWQDNCLQTSSLSSHSASSLSSPSSSPPSSYISGRQWWTIDSRGGGASQPGWNCQLWQHSLWTGPPYLGFWSLIFGPGLRMSVTPNLHLVKICN